MKKLLQCFNPTNPKPNPLPPPGQRQSWKPSNEWIKLTIAEGDGGFYLFTLLADDWVADTWHESIEEAKHQAEYAYGVKENNWKEC